MTGVQRGALPILRYLVVSRDQMLMVWRVEEARAGSVSLRDGGGLVNLFRAGRG